MHQQSYSLYFYTLEGFVRILCHERNHTLVHEHVHRVYTAILGLQFESKFGIACMGVPANYCALI